MWRPVHGCAIPLPKRSHRRRGSYGVRLFGPKPSAFFSACARNFLLRWIYQNGGAEGVIDFALERADLAHNITGKQRWMRLVRSGLRLQETLEEQRKELEEEKATPAPQLSWEQRRQLLIQRDNQRRQQSSQSGVAARLAATPKPSPLTLQRQRLERTLNASPAMSEPFPTAPVRTSPRSRMKGECGIRIGGKLDKLLAEIRHEAVCESACCEAPIAVIEQPPEVVIHDVVDPPMVETNPGADGDDRAPVEPAAGGGTSGFPIYKPEQIREDGLNLWSLVSGHEVSIGSGVADGLSKIQAEEITAAAQLKALSELQAVLRSTSAALDWESPVCVPAGDLVLVFQMALQRLG